MKQAAHSGKMPAMCSDTTYIRGTYSVLEDSGNLHKTFTKWINQGARREAAAVRCKIPSPDYKRPTFPVGFFFPPLPLFSEIMRGNGE